MLSAAGSLLAPFWGGQTSQQLLLLARSLCPSINRALSSLALPQAPSTPPQPFPPAPLEAHDRFSSILSCYRSQYPEAVWSKIVNQFPLRTRQPPLAIDIAVGAEGRAGVELAQRGFRVLSVGGDASIVNRTFVYANEHRARINLITAKVERDMVHSEAADLVTLMHGLHLLADPQAALHEAHRILRPRGRLVVAFNDRDLGNSFAQQLEGVVEAHVQGYRRVAQQHEPGDWAPVLEREGLFRLVEFNTHANPVVLRNLATLSDMLNAQPFVREALTGPARKQFNAAVRELAERCFGEGPLLLPFVTRMYILEKVTPPPKLQ